MNPILADIYSTILPSAPTSSSRLTRFCGWPCSYVLMIFRGTKRRPRSLRFLEEAVADKQAKSK